MGFSILAVLFIILGLLRFREAYQARNWALTSGTVVSSQVNEFTAKGGRKRYTPLVVYAYSVDGDRYMSSRIAFHQLTTGSRGGAAAFAGAFPRGRSVQVHYDPDNPQNAVLEPGEGAWPRLLLGGGFAALALLSRLVQMRMKKAAR